MGAHRTVCDTNVFLVAHHFLSKTTCLNSITQKRTLFRHIFCPPRQVKVLNNPYPFLNDISSRLCVISHCVGMVTFLSIPSRQEGHNVAVSSCPLIDQVMHFYGYSSHALRHVDCSILRLAGSCTYVRKCVHVRRAEYIIRL